MLSLDKEDHICNGKLCDDVALSWNLIHGGDSVKAHSKNLKACLLCGGHMTSKSSIDFSKVRIYRSAVEKILKTSGGQDLCNILLLITPMVSQLKNEHEVHSFCRESHNHLGVTTLTHEELKLIERQHRPDTYSIVHCTRPIELDDAVKNTPIKDQIFQMVRQKSKAVKRTWYRGNVVRLSYRSSKSRLVGVSPTRNPYGIRSLEHPQIPVRMQHQTPSEVANISCLGIEYMSHKKSLHKNLLRNVQRDFYSASQKSLIKIHFNSLPKPTSCLHKLYNRARRWRVKKFFRRNIAKVQAQKLVGKKDDQEHTILPNSHMSKDCIEDIPPPDKNGVQLLLKPHELRESMDYIHLPSSRIESSTTFTHPKDSPLSNYSLADLIQLDGKLLSPNAKQDLSQFARLIEQINERLVPQEEHVKKFFRMAEFLDFKMFVRHEHSFPGFPSTRVRRFRIECYASDNRRDYIASIAMPCRQLRMMALMYPRAKENFRFVESAFELTAMPSVVTKWLRKVLEAVGARFLIDCLGELAYDWVCPRCALLELIRDQEYKDL